MCEQMEGRVLAEVGAIDTPRDIGFELVFCECVTGIHVSGKA